MKNKFSQAVDIIEIFHPANVYFFIFHTYLTENKRFEYIRKVFSVPVLLQIFNFLCWNLL